MNPKDSPAAYFYKDEWRFKGEGKWKSSIPVKGCGHCVDGTVHHMNYPPTDCIKCNGVGTVEISKVRSIKDMDDQITKNLKR